MAKFYIKERVDGEVVRQYILKLPDITQPKFYRQIVSYSAFSNHWKKLLYRNNLKGLPTPRYFYCIDEYDFYDFEKSFFTDGFFDDNIPTIEFDDIKMFYCFINWDYLRKKFTKD